MNSNFKNLIIKSNVMICIILFNLNLKANSIEYDNSKSILIDKKIINATCSSSGNNIGCESHLSCPSEYRFTNIKAACDLEQSRFNIDMNKIKSNSMLVLKSSDSPKAYCKINNNNINKDSIELSSFIDQKLIKFGCADQEFNDKNGGGDCRIRIQATCSKFKEFNSKEIKFMTYNIHGGKDSRDNPSIPQIVKVIQTDNPDVIALQEVLSKECNTGSRLSQAGEIASQLGFNYIYAPVTSKKKCKIGNAVLSRYPIKFETIIEMPQGSENRRGANEFRNALVVKVIPYLKLFEKDTVFISTHFSVYNSILDVSEKSLPLDINQGIPAKKIISLINQPEYSNKPIVLAGDINNKYLLLETENLQSYNWESSSISNLYLKFNLNKKAIPTIHVLKSLIENQGQEKAEKHSQIDYILTRTRSEYTNVSWEVSEKSKEKILLGVNEEGKKIYSYPSDHFALIFKWKLKVSDLKSP